MAKTILSIVETYRVDSEAEVETFIEEIKEGAREEGYVLKNCAYTLKEKKSKGDVIDSAYQVKVTKELNTFWEV